jgi:hypothetical protein
MCDLFIYLAKANLSVILLILAYNAKEMSDLLLTLI